MDISVSADDFEELVQHEYDLESEFLSKTEAAIGSNGIAVGQDPTFAYKAILDSKRRVRHLRFILDHLPDKEQHTLSLQDLRDLRLL